MAQAGLRIFALGGQAAPQVPLRLVVFQNFLNLPRHHLVQQRQTFCDVFMYRTFANPKHPSRLPNC